MSTPSDVVSVGQEVEARVLKINKKKRQIDLTMKTQDVIPAADVAALEEEEEKLPTAMEMALRRAMAAQTDDQPKPQADKATRKSRRVSQEQEDIISRTLRSQQK